MRDERDALDVGVLGQETVGAGGLAAALRAVPVVDRVARPDRRARARRRGRSPMTNPAGIVTEAMAATLGDRVIGVCDSPVGLVRRACAAAGVDPGPSLAAVTGRVDVDYLGLNHLGWLRALTVGGADLLPGLVADPQRLATFEEGRLFGADLIAALGTLPNEYLYWYYAAREALPAVLDAGRTRGEHVRDRQQRVLRRGGAAPATRPRCGPRPTTSATAATSTSCATPSATTQDVAVGGYESVAVALARRADRRRRPRELILNVRNGATVAGAAADAVIETVCAVDADGARPRPVPAADRARARADGERQGLRTGGRSTRRGPARARQRCARSPCIRWSRRSLPRATWPTAR